MHNALRSCRCSLWRFVVPGLHTNEKRGAHPFVGSALVLFVLGAGLAFSTLTLHWSS